MGRACELSFFAHLHVPLPGSPAFRCFVGFGGRMESETKSYPREGYTREGHSLRP